MNLGIKTKQNKMKIKDLKSKEQAEAIANFFNQCDLDCIEMEIKDVIELELDVAFVWIDTKQGGKYWVNLCCNV